MASRATQFRKVLPALVENRAAPRHRVTISTASVRRHGDPPSDAELCDLSVYGCRVRSPDMHAVDERLWVRFPGGNPIAATVVWTREGFTACRFDAPIERAQVRAMIVPAD
ncbi:PilZ domain-containing protein [Sphingomonas sp. PB4P5]|uniref:PilZ domain-containing protein n=1 Tax=Parasphingomonas puruogangriensis TaxID=3096155 RepID=UPI002FCBEF07